MKRCFILALLVASAAMMAPAPSLFLTISSFAISLAFAAALAFLSGILVRAVHQGLRGSWGYVSELERLRPEAEARGLKLLRERLSPAQLSAYDSRRYFEVTGCDSGASYRINHGTQGNVEQFDAMGQAVCRWCFGPENTFVAGDVMLAQKIALENYESGALRVANRLPIKVLSFAPALGTSRWWASRMSRIG